MKLDEQLKVLSSKDRREIVYAIENTGEETLDYGELTDQLVSEGYLNQDDRRRFMIQAYHQHLPELESQGLIENDTEQKEIKQRFDEDFQEALEMVRKLEK